MVEIVTAADPNYFKPLTALIKSCKYSITCFDLGLNKDQLAWLEQENVKIKQGILKVPSSVPGWQTWNKPYYLLDTPADKVLWIDADCVIVGDLEPIFTTIEKQAVLIRHPNYYYQPVEGDEYLANKFGVSLPLANFNCGVVGFSLSRDKCILDAWTQVIEDVIVNNEYPKYRWFDETALRVALKMIGKENIPLMNSGWNRFSYCSCKNVGEFMGQLRIGEGDVILHYTGCRHWLGWE